MFEQHDIDKLNSEITEWNKNNKSDLLNEMDALGIKHSKNSPNPTPLRRALKTSLRQRYGLINKVTYSMPRSAILLQKGVSRSHPISNPRQEKKWFAPTDRN